MPSQVARPHADDVTMTVHVPQYLAARLQAEAAQHGVPVDDLSNELLAAGLSRSDDLEAFIGSGHSGRSNLSRTHREIKAKATKDLAAREL
jgi:hypothetical protein